MVIKNKQKKKKTKTGSIRKYSAAVALVSVMLWMAAWFLPAYTRVGNPDDVITGGAAFLAGLLLAPILLSEGNGLLFAWLANIFYFIIIIALLRGKYENPKLGLFSLLVITLPLLAYAPGEIMFDNENDFDRANTGSAVLVWCVALFVSAALPFFTLIRKQRQMETRWSSE